MKNRDALAGWAGFLASPGASPEAMTPMEVDGYLTAMLVGPGSSMPSGWMSLLCGGDELAFERYERAQQAVEGINVHMQAIFKSLGNARKFRPMFMRADGLADVEAARIWARGFMKAAKLEAAGWYGLMEDLENRKLLAPLVVLTSEEKLEKLIEDVPLEQAEQDMSVALKESVPLIHRYFKTGTAETLVHAGGKIRPNEPCPCGSGKKYKKCCRLSD